MSSAEITLKRGADWFLAVKLIRADTNWVTGVSWRLQLRATKTTSTVLYTVTSPGLAYTTRSSDDADEVTVTCQIPFATTTTLPLGKLYTDLRMVHSTLGVQFPVEWTINNVPQITAAT